MREYMRKSRSDKRVKMAREAMQDIQDFERNKFHFVRDMGQRGYIKELAELKALAKQALETLEKNDLGDVVNDIKEEFPNLLA